MGELSSMWACLTACGRVVCAADAEPGLLEGDVGRPDPSPRALKRLSFKTTVRKASSSIQETIQGLPTAARSHLPVSRAPQPPTPPPVSHLPVSRTPQP